MVKIVDQYPDSNLKVKGYWMSISEALKISLDQVFSFSIFTKKSNTGQKLIFEYGESGTPNIVKLCVSIKKTPAPKFVSKKKEVFS